MKNTHFESDADFTEHAREAIKLHLVGLGHRIIAELRGPIDIEPIEKRSEGFQHATRAAGSIDVTISDMARELTVHEGRRLMQVTLDQNRSNPPTAVFAHNDVMAIGAIEELGARVVEAAELPGALPADTPRVSPDARREEIAARKAHLAWRFRT